MAIGGGALPRGRGGSDGPADARSDGGDGGNRLPNGTKDAGASETTGGGASPAGSGSYGHVLHTNLGSLSGVGVTSQAYSPHQQWLVLRSLATNTFVSVEPP